MVTGAPDYAEQADEILAEFGYSGKDIESFRKSGAI
jgi:crotonobetainyl-CoA:carnitine CoA-transferase CaiB-like acyl-CoA transferase